MPHYAKDLTKVVKALRKASKDAQQADILDKINKDQKTRYGTKKARPKSRNRKKT